MANMQVKQMLAEDDVLQLQALSLSPSHAAHFIVPSVVCEAEFNQLWYLHPNTSLGLSWWYRNAGTVP